jgi:hypothetical protein
MIGAMETSQKRYLTSKLDRYALGLKKRRQKGEQRSRPELEGKTKERRGSRAFGG